MIFLFYLSNLSILLSACRGGRQYGSERKFYLWLVRALMMVPLLAGEYVYMTYYSASQAVPLIFFSESVLGLIWFCTAHWLNHVAASEETGTGRFVWFERFAGLLTLGIGLCCFLNSPASLSNTGLVVISPHNILFFVNVFLLTAMVRMAWCLERFWRGLSPKQRWEYKCLAAGICLICGTMAWAVSYRITYHRLRLEHLHLLSALLVFAWGLMIYAVARHRLLNRKIYISRKVVYAFVAPLTFGLYLICIGLIVLMMRVVDLSFPAVLHRLLWVVGGVGIGLLAVSGKVRHDVKYFVSTHFYNNKYEYRDEWLDFSQMLQGALTEMEVVNALHQIMAQSLYTNIIFIWTGDRQKGYRLVFRKGGRPVDEREYRLAADHPLVIFLQKNSLYYTSRTKHDLINQNPGSEKQTFFPELQLVLCAPLAIGEQMVGIVGLGPEFTGGRYGKDDFDLLAALGTQAASALLAARMAEKLARTRQQEAWDVMSAFILHDIKNAASMLSLIRQNAPKHLHDPEFQEDMLETVDDALKRMAKVQDRLSALKREIIPVWQEADLCGILAAGCRKLEKRLRRLCVSFDCKKVLPVKTDPELLMRVVENILLNAIEANNDETIVEIYIRSNGHRRLTIELSDNGPGLPADLLPDAIFRPFKTTKPEGSGIGLWQARRLTAILGGNITAENSEGGGARFLIALPLERSGGEITDWQKNL